MTPDRLAELRALAGMVRKHAGHSGSCCVQPDGTTVVVTRESCKCGPVERAAHDVLGYYGPVRDLPKLLDAPASEGLRERLAEVLPVLIHEFRDHVPAKARAPLADYLARTLPAALSDASGAGDRAGYGESGPPAKGPFDADAIRQRVARSQAQHRSTNR